VRRSLAIAAVAAAVVALVYVVFVRTRWGQEVDDLAFEARAAVTPQTTSRTDRLLHAVTRDSLAVLGAVVVLLALAQRRIRLVFVVGGCLAGALLTTEALKHVLLTRPVFPGVGGWPHNSYPSGHATIGMMLSLGIVMVSTSRTRRVATVVAAVAATAFGTAVLASGWHRPSDSVGAYGVALAWFCLGNAVLVATDPQRLQAPGAASATDRPPSKPLLVAAAAAIASFLGFELWRSIDADGLHTVEYVPLYILSCIVIDVLGVIVVYVFAVLTADRARWRRRLRDQQAAATA
jgi:membrane-associated phospholipid phosphatase